MTDMRKRNAEIVRLRVSGLSLDEIGRMHGLTRERVRQILIKLGGPSVVCVRQAQRVARQDQLTHDRGAIAICAWERDMWIATRQSGVDEHRGILDRLGLTGEFWELAR